MTTRDTIAARGRRKGQAAAQRFIDELRQARLNLGKSQATAARQAGIDRSLWTRIERGERPVPSWEVAGLMAASVGLDLSVQLFPAARILRDEPQVRLLADLREELGSGWRWRYEVRVRDDDQRAWDAVATQVTTQESVRVEAETALRDVQALCRRIQGKREAAGGGRVIMVLRDTARNRAALRDAAEIIASEFPVGAREAFAALRAGRTPTGDACLIIRKRADPIVR